MFQFDPNAAAQADRGGYITESGVVRGTFTDAVAVAFDTGARAIEFSFESDTGERANYLTIITMKKGGKERAFGYGMIMSCMGLMGINELRVEKKDDKTHLPDFCGKPIALALQREEFEKRDGSIGWKMNILHFFDPQTCQTYSEKINNAPAQKYKRKIRDKVLQANAGSAGMDQPPLEDDLPF